MWVRLPGKSHRPVSRDSCLPARREPLRRPILYPHFCAALCRPTARVVQPLRPVFSRSDYVAFSIPTQKRRSEIVAHRSTHRSSAVTPVTNRSPRAAPWCEQLTISASPLITVTCCHHQEVGMRNLTAGPRALAAKQTRPDCGVWSLFARVACQPYQVQQPGLFPTYRIHG